MHGIVNPIPGHVYLDDKGKRIIYLGRGTYFNEWKGEVIWETGPDHYLYIKEADMKRRITQGRLSTDLTHFFAGNKPDFFKVVCFSRKPRKLVEDKGEVFPVDYFRDFTTEDESGEFVHKIKAY